jgi:nicotinate-nucleotide adenylyltransferase
MTRRTGILGGTFDPIHNGHLDLGAAAVDALALDDLIVIPSHRPPHRSHPGASGFHRFAMAAMAVSTRTHWRVSDIELMVDGPSYTSATLDALRADGYAPTDLFFVIGADAFAEVHSWRDYPAILGAAHFAVVSRPGYPAAALPSVLPALTARMVSTDHYVGPNFRSGESREAAARETFIFLIEASTADVSSTAIRQRLGDGLPIGDLVPVGVEQHIQQHGLYGHEPNRAIARG